MGKQRKKVRCICKGQPDRVHQGTDRQKHIHKCQMAINYRKQER